MNCSVIVYVTLGCLGDLGWYCIRAILFAKNYILPVRASGVALKKNQHGIILNMIAWLEFPDATFSTFECSFDTTFRQNLEICGTEGILRVSDFVLNENEQRATWNTEVGGHLGPLHKQYYSIKTEHSTGPCCQEVELFNNFSGCFFSIFFLVLVVTNFLLRSGSKKGSRQQVDHSIAGNAESVERHIGLNCSRRQTG